MREQVNLHILLTPCTRLEFHWHSSGGCARLRPSAFFSERAKSRPDSKIHIVND